jgi:hypothetical protein
MSADNQQERLIGWILGFVDGEGCFSIGFVKQPDRVEATRIRKGYRTGVQIAHKFSVMQGMRSIHVLKELHSYFGVGKIYVNRRHDNHKENMYHYTVARRDDLMNVIIPFFETNHLHSAKQQDFELFARCVRLMSDNKHFTPQGVIEIAQLAEQMNHRVSREKLIRILRDYTPDTKDGIILREDIVQTVWRHTESYSWLN